MHILAQCPGCNRQMELDVQSLDRRLRCPSCGRLFKVPDAQQLERNYKNLHGDVKRLMEIGLIERLYDGRIRIPFSSIVAELKMAA